MPLVVYSCTAVTAHQLFIYSLGNDLLMNSQPDSLGATKKPKRSGTKAWHKELMANQIKSDLAYKPVDQENHEDDLRAIQRT
ncbi:hypothetical protein ACN38_g5295 [Penicillium nordicum]|uniref:Uncharacterized protein n=1 Tax=Penicillium nordicum TaxID=229535 RepID=A0A0M9WGC2_9EURO|nr:hypothetical protein ACN38_g5295 [Penicillium nordicum]